MLLSLGIEKGKEFRPDAATVAQWKAAAAGSADKGVATNWKAADAFAANVLPTYTKFRRAQSPIAPLQRR